MFWSSTVRGVCVFFRPTAGNVCDKATESVRQWTCCCKFCEPHFPHYLLLMYVGSQPSRVLWMKINRVLSGRKSAEQRGLSANKSVDSGSSACAAAAADSTLTPSCKVVIQQQWGCRQWSAVHRCTALILLLCVCHSKLPQPPHSPPYSNQNI